MVQPGILLLIASTTVASGELRPEAPCDSAPELPDNHCSAAEPTGVTRTVVLLQRGAMQSVSQPLMALLEDKGRSIVCRNSNKPKNASKADSLKGEADGDEDGPPPEVLGDAVPLTPEGFQAVMDAPCGFEKELFVGRVVQDLGLEVKDSEGLHDWMKVVYTEAHTFEELKELVSKASKDQENRWLVKAAGRTKKAPKDDFVLVVPEAMPNVTKLPTDGEVALLQRPAFKAAANKPKAGLPGLSKAATKKKQASADEFEDDFDVDDGGSEDNDEGFEDDTEEEEPGGRARSMATKQQGSRSRREHHSSSKRKEADMEDLDVSAGETAPLNQKGYIAVTKLRSQSQMETYVRRVVADRGLYILDEGALKGIVPYYNGVKSKQTFKALATEIMKATKLKKKSWLSTKQPKEEEEEEEAHEPSLEALGRKPSPSPASRQKSDAHMSLGQEEDIEEDDEHGPSLQALGRGRSLVQEPQEEEADTLGSGALERQDDTVAVEPTEAVLLEKKKKRHRDHRAPESLMQTHSRSESSTAFGWVGAAFSLIEGQAMYWLGARVTLVACAGSLLFGLFVFDESTHQARAAALEPEDGFSNAPAQPQYHGYTRHAPRPVLPMRKEPPLADLRNAAPSLRQSSPSRHN